MPGKEPDRDRAKKKPIFVVHKHDATRLHYDLRLEVDGVLKSWSVPKGPSMNPKDRRLAVQTEDHPLEYADFEGVIPEGEYGAGTVMVWDIGTYENASRWEHRDVPMAEGLRHGRAKFILHGKKLKGKFVLTRFERGGDRTWLLIKMKDEHASSTYDPVRDEPDSALTGRSLEEIARSSAQE